MEKERSEIEKITEYLPAGWEGKARELGALSRARNIQSAEELFEVIMLYVANEMSFQQVSAVLRLTGGLKLAKNAVQHRVKSSWKWLQWMGQELCTRERYTMPKPTFLGEKSVILVDGSDESVKGSKRSDWRLHYAFDLFGFSAKAVDLTPISDGEKLTRYEVKENEIWIGDRMYCTIQGIEHVLRSKGDYVLRFKSKAFNLYDGEGEKLEILPLLRGLEAFESSEFRANYRLADGTLRPIRLVAMKKDTRSINESKRKMMRKSSKKQEKKPQKDTLELNEYIVLATSTDYTKEQILELYRARWQIEQVFYRLKSLFGYSEIPCKNDDSARAWFYGKILVAGLGETMLKRESFSPSWEGAIGATFGAKLVE